MTRFWPLAVLLAVLALLVSPRTASALTAAQPETRVGGFELVALPLVGLLAAPSTEKHEGNSVAYDETARGYSLAAEGLPAAESWGNAATLERHFADHGADFGSTSAEEYAQQASEFFQRSQAEGFPTKVDPSGVIRVYDPNTNTFGAFNPDGTTRTFFTPSSPTYWLRQPGVEPWTPGGGQ